MAKYRVSFPGDAAPITVTADRMQSDGSALRLYRAHKDGVEEEVASFTSGTWTACWPVG